MYIFYDSNGVISYSIAVAQAPVEGFTSPFEGYTALYLDDTQYADIRQRYDMYKIVNGQPVEQSESTLPPVPLATSQQAKIAEITSAYNQALTSGFISSASGVAVQFAYAEINQTKFSKLLAADTKGWLTYPVTVYAADTSAISLTQPQLEKLFQDIFTFELINETKLHTLIGQINTSTTPDQVAAIAW